METQAKTNEQAFTGAEVTKPAEEALLQWVERYVANNNRGDIRAMKTILFFLALVATLLAAQAQNRQTVKTGMAEVNGAILYYEIAGEGQPLVLVHGNGGDRRHWDDQFIPLSKNFQVIRYDVCGFGKSPAPNLDEQGSNYNDLKNLLDYLDIKQAHICGLSMGSGIAVDFAMAYPEMCLSLISVGPWANGYNSPETENMFQVMAQAGAVLKEQGNKAAIDFLWEGNDVFKNTFPNKQTLKRMKLFGYDYSFWHMLNKSKRYALQPLAAGRLKEVKVPTLIVTAEFDLIACKEIADLMESEIAGAKKVSIKGAGHCMYMDKHKEFNKIVKQFIGDVE
jgi:3-oxoadipate enol-lactonase